MINPLLYENQIIPFQGRAVRRHGSPRCCIVGSSLEVFCFSSYSSKFSKYSKFPKFLKVLKILKHEGVRTRMEGKVSRRLFNIRTRESRKRGDSRCVLFACWKWKWHQKVKVNLKTKQIPTGFRWWSGRCRLTYPTLLWSNSLIAIFW